MDAEVRCLRGTVTLAWRPSPAGVVRFETIELHSSSSASLSDRPQLPRTRATC